MSAEFVYMGVDACRNSNSSITSPIKRLRLDLYCHSLLGSQSKLL